MFLAQGREGGKWYEYYNISQFQQMTEFTDTNKRIWQIRKIIIFYQKKVEKIYTKIGDKK